MIFAHAALTSGMGCATMVSAITGMFGRKAEEKIFPPCREPMACLFRLMQKEWPAQPAGKGPRPAGVCMCWKES